MNGDSDTVSSAYIHATHSKVSAHSRSHTSAKNFWIFFVSFGLFDRHVDQALEQRIYRVKLIEDKITDMIAEGMCYARTDKQSVPPTSNTYTQPIIFAAYIQQFGFILLL